MVSAPLKYNYHNGRQLPDDEALDCVPLDATLRTVPARVARHALLATERPQAVLTESTVMKQSKGDCTQHEY